LPFENARVFGLDAKDAEVHAEGAKENQLKKDLGEEVDSAFLCENLCSLCVEVEPS